MKTYTVSGALPYRGHKPGETFEEEILPAEERRAAACGSIEVAKTGSKQGRGRKSGRGRKATPPSETPAESPTPDPTPEPEGDGGDGDTQTPASPGNDE